MAEPMTIEQSDIDDMIALLRESNGPVPLDTLVERYVSLLKERVTAQMDAPAPAA
jgi:hypothetical protein